ncbi:MAG: hypothetical protein ACRDRX_04505 [Pseudonocardiaceae bacterium]
MSLVVTPAEQRAHGVGRPGAREARYARIAEGKRLARALLPPRIAALVVSEIEFYHRLLWPAIPARLDTVIGELIELERVPTIGILEGEHVSEQAAFEGWTILEVMGHRRLAGYLCEQQIGGASFLRLDIPGNETCTRCSGACGLQGVDLDGRPTHTEEPCTECNGFGTQLKATQFYSASAVYCITPTTEEVARRIAARTQVTPVQRWELPALSASQEDDECGGHDD